jgi:DNA replication protein DnaC
VTDIRLRYLDDDEADRLYAAHPELGRSPDTYCPTCAKNGTYRWKGADYPCDCEMQLQLHKHYLAAGIGATYQCLDWDDLENAEIVKTVKEYAEDKDRILRGAGLILTGDLGTGKTMAATLCLKEFIRAGLSCFATTFAEMIELYTAGWYSDEQRAYFNRKVIESQVLLLDDVGRALKRKNQLEETTFDTVLRTRVQHRRATILTTNLSMDELGEGYGGAVLRLLREKATAIEVTGEDFSKKAKQREDAEKAAGEWRAIK